MPLNFLSTTNLHPHTERKTPFVKDDAYYSFIRLHHSQQDFTNETPTINTPDILPITEVPSNSTILFAFCSVWKSSTQSLLMENQPPLGCGPTRRKNQRTIVDPVQWETAEVGGPEGFALRHKSTSRSKVSSLRSSLFQKHAKMLVEPSNPQTEAHYDSLIFQHVKNAQDRSIALAFGTCSHALTYCEYGKSNKKAWPKDIFAFFHNALRCELLDLTSILKALQKIGARLTVRHFVLAKTWWQTCSLLILDYLDMEVKYIEPWIAIGIDENACETDSAMSLFQAMPQRQQELRDKLISISKAFGGICDLPPAASSSAAPNTAPPIDMHSLSQKAIQVIALLDTFVIEMVNYMHDQEEVFTPVLSEAYKSEKKDKELLMGKAIKHFVKKGRKGDYMLVLLTRWMDDIKMAKAHTKMIQEWHDCIYVTLVTQFENHHANLVQQLDQSQSDHPLLNLS